MINDSEIDKTNCAARIKNLPPPQKAEQIRNWLLEIAKTSPTITFFQTKEISHLPIEHVNFTNIAVWVQKCDPIPRTIGSSYRKHLLPNECHLRQAAYTKL